MPAQILPIAKYNCTQQTLYSIGDTVYGNLENNLAPFTAFKSKYTPLFITGLRDRVIAARALPDEETRNNLHEVLRVQLNPLKDTCRLNFQMLKDYNRDAFPVDEQDTMNEAAGQNYFTASEGENWEMVEGLNSNMKSFITNHLTELTGAGFMPGTFQAKVDADALAFHDKYDLFKLARETGEATAEKIEANNIIHDEIMGICDDAPSVFPNNPAKQKLFVWEVIKDLISPPGSASLKVTAKRASDNTLLANTSVTIQSAGKPPITGVTDANGELVFPNIDSADYTGSATNGALSASFVKEVNTGTDARITILLT